ncbi:unnamed protein product [Linum trigynum]|uniref:Uncharacterized protein n=1 Tax=Linum trigynum TaxID=586398 RepID=A0AAV2CBI6_9ROSI
MTEAVASETKKNGASQPLVPEGEEVADTGVGEKTPIKGVFQIVAPDVEDLDDRKMAPELVENLPDYPTPMKKLCLEDPAESLRRLLGNKQMLWRKLVDNGPKVPNETVGMECAWEWGHPSHSNLF